MYPHFGLESGEKTKVKYVVREVQKNNSFYYFPAPSRGLFLYHRTGQYIQSFEKQNNPVSN